MPGRRDSRRRQIRRRDPGGAADTDHPLASGTRYTATVPGSSDLAANALAATGQLGVHDRAAAATDAGRRPGAS